MEDKQFNDGKPGPGRPKGSINKSKLEAAGLAQRLLDGKYRKSLKERLLRGEVPPQVEIMLWCYAFGKPLDRPALPPPTPNEEPKQIEASDSYKQAAELLEALQQRGIIGELAKLVPTNTNGQAQ